MMISHPSPKLRLRIMIDSTGLRTHKEHSKSPESRTSWRKNEEAECPHQKHGGTDGVLKVEQFDLQLAPQQNLQFSA